MVNFKKFLPGARRGSHGNQEAGWSHGLFILGRELCALKPDLPACVPSILPFVCLAFFVEWEGTWVQESAGPLGPGFSCLQLQREGACGLQNANWEAPRAGHREAERTRRFGKGLCVITLTTVMWACPRAPAYLVLLRARLGFQPPITHFLGFK